MQMAFDNLRECKNAGIYTTVNAVIGEPGETEEDFEKTLDAVREIKFDEFFQAAQKYNPAFVFNVK